jgi:hypothetical protein
VSNELLPCPFCGCKAEMARKQPRRFWILPSSRVDVSCSNSKCGASFSRWHPNEWNTRAARPAPEYREPTLEDASRIADIARRLMRNDATYSDMFAALRAGGFVVRETK